MKQDKLNQIETIKLKAFLEGQLYNVKRVIKRFNSSFKDGYLKLSGVDQVKTIRQVYHEEDDIKKELVKLRKRRLRRQQW